MTTPAVTSPQAAPELVRATGPTDVGRYSPERSGGRLDAVDLLRGLVMVIMLLDHTRDFTHSSGFLWDPTDLSRTTPAVFLTRWITHFCASVFVFLAGTGAYLQRLRGKPTPELSRFLLTRGLWLVVLEFTVVRLLTWWNVDPGSFGVFQVIWALGVSMMVLAAFVRLPLAASIGVGAAMVLFHNALDGIAVAPWQGPGSPAPGLGDAIWMLLHQPGLLPIGGSMALVLYPLIPWVGVMLLGWAFGAVYAWEAERRRRVVLRAGLALVAAFVLLRLTNLYGNPSPWSTQASATFTALSFLNVEKYPPSLLFLCMTLGPALVLLALLDGRTPGRLGRPLVVFGRVPLFFYLLQWPTAKLFGIAVAVALGHELRYFAMHLGQLFADQPPVFGGPIWLTHLCWIAGALLLYPLCRWYAGVKARRKDWWLGYL